MAHTNDWKHMHADRVAGVPKKITRLELQDSSENVLRQIGGFTSHVIPVLNEAIATVDAFDEAGKSHVAVLVAEVQRSCQLVIARLNSAWNAKQPILLLSEDIYHKLFSCLDYHAVDQLSRSCSSFDAIVSALLPKLPRRKVCEIQIFAMGYFDDAEAVGRYSSSSTVSPVGESPALDVVITERRQRVISNNLWRKQRTCYRGDLPTIMPGIRAYLRHAEIRMMSLHGMVATREIAKQFSSISSVQSFCVEIKVAESTRLSLDGFIRGLSDLNDDFLRLCANRGVQELKLHIDSDDLQSSVTQDGFLDFCFQGGSAHGKRRRRLYVADNMLAMINGGFVPAFIKACKQSSKCDVLFHAVLDGQTKQLPILPVYHDFYDGSLSSRYVSTSTNGLRPGCLQLIWKSAEKSHDVTADEDEQASATSSEEEDGNTTTDEE